MLKITTVIPVEGAHGIFADSTLTEGGHLLFGSFWGRDTSVQEFLARMQLGASDSGIQSFKVNGEEISLGNIDRLQKRTGRFTSPVYGQMNHLWVYDKALVRDNQSSRTAYLMGDWSDVDFHSKAKTVAEKLADAELLDGVWEKFKQISPLSLIDSWQIYLINYGFANGWLDWLNGNGIMALRISLPKDFEEEISLLIKSNELIVYADYRHVIEVVEEKQELDTADAELDATDEVDTTDAEVIPIVDFVQDYSQSLLDSVSVQNTPVHNSKVVNANWDAVMDNMLRPPFNQQRDRVHAASKLLLDQGERAVVINGEMGTGKTMMGICTAEILRAEGTKRCLVICPPHLVYKWRREIKQTVPDARVWVLNGPDTLIKLLKLRELMGTQDVPEYFIMGRVRMRMGFTWKPAYTLRTVVIKDELDDQSFIQKYCACPRCGTIVKDDEGVSFTPLTFPSNVQLHCDNNICNEQMWTLIRPDNKPFDRDVALRKSLCKLPTIGPKTAQTLIDGFGGEELALMMEDNIYEFINLIDESGELVFNDRQAARFERRMAKMEISFGQGGYQPTEFVKRYFPSGFFGSLIVDEGHEYKNQGSAQGQAMGVLAAQAKKVILLTGTLMGGYADDLFYLLWRIMPAKMIEDGFRYNDRGSIGPAAMAFMREHGVLKDVYKESSNGNHKTAKGSKVTINTSKAPGFSPMGIMRFVLPYTVFLRLTDLDDGNLPGYQEIYTNVELSEEQRKRYDSLASTLQDELRHALRLGDRTLLGVVLNALLAWPDCCFRSETVKHPRTRGLLAFVPTVFGENVVSPKEQKLIDGCLTAKAQGHRVLVYSVYSGKRDTMSRLQSLLAETGLKVAVLRSSVKTQEREDWILDQVDRGIDVLITNPELVKTGLDLLEFPRIKFMQTGYDVYTLQQGARRSWRIGQTHDVEVEFLGYENTAQTECLRLMAKKIAVSQSTSGCMPETGLDILNQDAEPIEIALARQLLAR